MPASLPDSLGENLAFVAAAVQRGRLRPFPVGIAAAWALYVAVGYAWADYSPHTCGWFFLLAWLPALVASGYFGRRAARRSGDVDRAADWRLCAHFMSILLAGAALAVLALTQGLDGMIVGQLIALSCGLIYFLAGVHYNPRFYALGLLLIAGSVLVKIVPGYGWTILGLLTAAGLLVAALIPLRTPAE